MLRLPISYAPAFPAPYRLQRTPLDGVDRYPQALQHRSSAARLMRGPFAAAHGPLPPVACLEPDHCTF